MSIGKKIRLVSWFRNERTFLVALDESIPRGLLEFPWQIKDELEWLKNTPVDGLVLHPGTAFQFEDQLVNHKPWIAKLTTNSSLIEDRMKRANVGSVIQAVKMGASGVAVNVFLGSNHEKDQLEFLAECVFEGEAWGMPVIAFINPPSEQQFDPNALAYVCRLGAELGADMIKTDYPGTPEDFKMIIDHAIVPIIVEYAPKPATDDDTLEIVKNVIKAGGAGVNFGARLLNSSRKQILAKEISKVIHG